MRSNVSYSDFLASAVKYKSEENAVGAGKLDIRSESRKGAFDMLET